MTKADIWNRICSLACFDFVPSADEITKRIAAARIWVTVLKELSKP